MDLPERLYDQLDTLVPPSGWWAQPAATVAVVALLVTILLAIWQIRAARRKDWENDARAALVDAETQMGLLKDAIIEISAARQTAGTETPEHTAAYRTAHGATRRAIEMLKLYGFGTDVTQPYWQLREDAYAFVYGAESLNRSHPGLGTFMDKQSAHNALLSEYVVRPRYKLKKSKRPTRS